MSKLRGGTTRQWYGPIGSRRAGLELIPGEFSLYVNDMAASAKSKLRPRTKLPAKQPAGPEIDAWVQLAHAYHRIARRLELALIPHGLSLAQFEVLARLHFDGPINQNDLAHRLLVTKGNVCGLIDRLEKANLVKRRADPADRRANRLILTKDGSELLAAALPDHLAIIQCVLSGLNHVELRVLHDSAERLADAAKE
jgi:DNA-binding MarR family transcriptional regulator